MQEHSWGIRNYTEIVSIKIILDFGQPKSYIILYEVNNYEKNTYDYVSVQSNVRTVRKGTYRQFDTKT